MSVLLLVIVAASSVLVMAGDAQDKSALARIQFSWTAPTSGTSADHYVAEALVNERDTLVLGSFPTTEAVIFAEYGNKYRIRVAAVDQAGIQGPWSLWSEPLSPDLGPPSF